MTKERLIKKFGERINEMSCVYIGDGENSLRYFLEKYKPKNVIEIGTYQGVSTAIISEYAKKVWAIDIIDLPLRNEIFNFLNITNVEFIQCEKDFSSKEKIIKDIAKDNKIDMIFIDGDHWGDALKQEYNLCKSISKLILIHDYEEAFPIVYNFCNNLKNEKDIKNLFCLVKNDKSSKR